MYFCVHIGDLTCGTPKCERINRLNWPLKTVLYSIFLLLVPFFKTAAFFKALYTVKHVKRIFDFTKHLLDEGLIGTDVV